jgi:hypothetical protein
MAYNDPQREEYIFPSTAFGVTTESKVYQGPPGKVGLVRDIMTSLSVAASGTTSVPEIDVGTVAGDFTYARHRLGTTAILGNVAGEFRARSLAMTAQGRTGSAPPALNDYAGHVALETARIPADTPFTITRTAGVGAPAGTGDSIVFVDWY